jgi:hypothetical protein
MITRENDHERKTKAGGSGKIRLALIDAETLG